MLDQCISAAVCGGVTPLLCLAPCHHMGGEQGGFAEVDRGKPDCKGKALGGSTELTVKMESKE